MLAGAVARSGDVAAVQQIVARATAAPTPAGASDGAAAGLDRAAVVVAAAAADAAAAGEGAARPRRQAGRASRGAGRADKLSATGGDTGALAKRVVAKLEWPASRHRSIEAPPLTAEEQKRFDAGGDLYKNLCVGCHQPDGRGKEKMAPTLVESRYTTGADATAAMRILLAGKEGPVGLMPPLGGALNDEQIAAVLTYMRREWGNTGTPVAADDVTEVRGLTKTRTRPWTDAELTAAGRGPRRSEGSDTCYVLRVLRCNVLNVLLRAACHVPRAHRATCDGLARRRDVSAAGRALSPSEVKHGTWHRRTRARRTSARARWT